MIRAENARDNAFAGILAYGLAMILAALVCLGFAALFTNYYSNVFADTSNTPKYWGLALSLPLAMIAGWQAIFAIKHKFSETAGPAWLRAATDNIVVRVLIFLSLLFGISTEITGRLSAMLEKDFAWTGSFFDAVAVVTAFIVMSKLFHRRSLSSWGLGLKGMPLDSSIGFICGAIMMSLIAGGLSISNVYHVVTTNWSAQVLPALAFFSMAAFVEELIFRGYIFQAVEVKRGTTISIAVTALLFGFAHLMNDIPGAPMWVKFYGCACLVFEAGILLNAAFILRRSLWFATGMHWAWNFFEGPIFGMDVSGTDGGPSVFTGRLIGDVFATGGQFGPEASLSGLIVGTIFGAVLIWLCVRKGQWLSRQQAMQVEALRESEAQLQTPETQSNRTDDNQRPKPGVGYDI